MAHVEGMKLPRTYFRHHYRESNAGMKEKLIIVAALIAFHLLHMIAPLTVSVTVFLVAAAILIPKKNREIREKLASRESSDTF